MNELFVSLHRWLTGSYQYSRFDGNCVLMATIGPIGICVATLGFRLDLPVLGYMAAGTSALTIFFLAVAFVAERRALTVIQVKRRLANLEYEKDSARNWYWEGD